MEPSESAKDAVEREVLEETGVVCEAMIDLGSRTHPDTAVDLHYWYCEWISGEPRVQESKKVDRVRWVAASDVDEFFTSDLAPTVRSALALIEHSSD